MSKNEENFPAAAKAGENQAKDFIEKNKHNPSFIMGFALVLIQWASENIYSD